MNNFWQRYEDEGNRLVENSLTQRRRDTEAQRMKWHQDNYDNL
jgi:hypothetical protein